MLAGSGLGPWSAAQVNRMFERFRWPMIVIPAIVVGAIELLSDTLLDEALPFPWDTVAVVLVILALSAAFWRLAIDRMRVLGNALEQRNAELVERNRTARALHHVSVAIAALADVDEVLQAVVDQARALLAADVAVLLLAVPAGEPSVRAWSGPPRSVDGARSGPDPLAAVDPALARVRLAAPLQRGGETIGQLYIGCSAARSFDVDEVETLSSLANQAAVALENARLQERLRELAVVAERERIAREMHDGLAQVLGYVNTKSQAVESFLEADRVDEARVQLAELSAAARSVYVDVREAILGLRSPIRPEVGLVGAIEEYAGRFADASKLAVVVEAAPAAREARLASEIESQLFRIVQEALTNVRKHASAGRVTLGVDIEGEMLVLTVTDDGRGFAAGSAGSAWPHYGMDAIRERAGVAGATVTWSPARLDGVGTLVRVAVPLDGSLLTDGGGRERQTPLAAGAASDPR
jgi:signal transduction histidine kinase